VSTDASAEVVRADDQTLVQVAAPSGANRLADAHVLIIGINYRPEVTGIAPYTAGMAEHLAAAAGSLTIMAGVPHYPSWKVPDGYRRRHRHRELAEDGVELIRYNHYVPKRQSALRRACYELSFLANVSLSRIRRRPDLVIAVSPSLGGAVAGARIAEHFQVPLITVVQDLMASAAAQSGIAGGSRVAGATGRLEGFALRRSTLVAPVSSCFLPRLEAYGVPADRIRLLPNWTHIGRTRLDQGSARAELGWPNDRFLVAHTGNMGLKQDLGNVIKAAELLVDNTDVQFLLIGDGNQRRVLEKLASDLPNLSFVDPLDEEGYLKALAAADLLLINERPSVGDMSLPSKLTSYLSAGRPILAAVSELGATATELRRVGGAARIVPPGSPEQVANAVVELRAAGEQRAQMAEAGVAYARSQLAVDSAMERLTALVEESLMLPPPAREEGQLAAS
jgi:glycosyltransferase involved in cell wall biosynthesis